MIFGWLICKVKGKHQRGRRVNALPVRLPDEVLRKLSAGELAMYQCPRCKAGWTRKIRATA
jgi:hypothetical protein